MNQPPLFSEIIKDAISGLWWLIKVWALMLAVGLTVCALLPDPPHTGIVQCGKYGCVQ